MCHNDHLVNKIITGLDSKRSINRIISIIVSVMAICIPDISECIVCKLKYICIYFGLFLFLIAVCKIYSGQKAIRVKQAVDRQKMLVHTLLLLLLF